MKTIKKLSVFAVMFLGLLTAGCSSNNDGPSVGDVHNSECSQTRAAAEGSDGDVPEFIVRLTRSGEQISGELENYPTNCSHGNLRVDCQQKGSLLDINVLDETKGGDGIAVTCLCWLNIYFTLYDVEGDTFTLRLDGEELGNVSLTGRNSVEINRTTGEVTYK